MVTFNEFINEVATTKGTPDKIVNGQVPENLMMRVDSQGNKLARTAALDFLRAVNDSKQFTGEQLQLVGPNSSYRTYQQQEAMARQYGIGQAARPGRSNHGFGLAIDLVKNGAWKWFVGNGPKYGYYQLNSTNEAHHFDYKKTVPEFLGAKLEHADGSPKTDTQTPQDTSTTPPQTQQSETEPNSSLPPQPSYNYQTVDDALQGLKAGFSNVFSGV